MTNTEKIDLLFEALKYIAGLWRRFGWPVTLDRVVRVDGVDVRVIVEDAAHTIGKAESEIDSLQADKSQDS